jgi:hypothetical protein
VIGTSVPHHGWFHVEPGLTEASGDVQRIVTVAGERQRTPLHLGAVHRLAVARLERNQQRCAGSEHTGQFDRHLVEAIRWCVDDRVPADRAGERTVGQGQPGERALLEAQTGMISVPTNCAYRSAVPS